MSLLTLRTEVVLAATVAALMWLRHNLRARRASRASPADQSPCHPARDRRAWFRTDRSVTLHSAPPRREPPGQGLLAQAGLHIVPALRRASDAAARIPWFGKRLNPDRDRDRSGTISPLRDVLDHVPVAIVGINEQMEVIFANERARSLLGCSVEVLNSASGKLLFPEHRATVAYGEFAQPVSRAFPAGTATQAVVVRRGDGSELPADMMRSECCIDGVPTRLAVIVDRSERYGLHRNRQELAHLTRISALGELAGSLAHELNQPLTAILSNAQAALRFMDADPTNLSEVRETLQDIVADNCRAGEIIRKMRALVRKGEVDLQPLDVGLVVRDVVLLSHSDAVLRGIRTVLDIDKDLPAVCGDRVQLQQVVLNLLLNGFDAVHDEAAANRVIAVCVWVQPDGTVRIDVRDRGHGLTVDQLDKIFKPFFTSKPHGLGLGLSISRTIVTAHGGRLWAENNADRGATFHIALPQAGTAESNRTCRQP